MGWAAGVFLAPVLGVGVSTAVFGFTPVLVVALALAVLSGLIVAALHAWLSISVRADQIIAGTIINIGSTAGRWAYEGGGGYTAAKHAVAVLTKTLRLELNGQPVRVAEIAPGMVRTDEFALNRLGDKAKADAVYAGVAEPLLAEDIADAVQWVATRPQHVNIDLLVVQPIAQAAAHKVHREG